MLVPQFPVRTCIACGAKASQAALLRVAPGPDGSLVVDQRRREHARGAYVCPSSACVEIAFKRRSFERALKLKSGLSPSCKDELRGALTQEVLRFKSEVLQDREE